MQNVKWISIADFSKDYHGFLVSSQKLAIPSFVITEKCNIFPITLRNFSEGRCHSSLVTCHFF
jgi:hypothetical protein